MKEVEAFASSLLHYEKKMKLFEQFHFRDILEIEHRALVSLFNGKRS